jgi:transketolase
MADGVPDETVRALETTAREVRRALLKAVRSAGGGPAAVSLAAVEIVTALLFRELRIDPAGPGAPAQDRLVVSGGSVRLALDATLTLRESSVRGASAPPDADPMRPDRSDRRSGGFLELTATGPGEALGMSVGLALGDRLAGRSARTYAILDEGEFSAGSTWEALRAGGHFHPSNLVVVVVHHGPGSGDSMPGPRSNEPILDELRALRFRTLEVDGHDFRSILGSFGQARDGSPGPTAIVAHTVPGKGVPALEGTHGKAPTAEELDRALAELGLPGASGGR